MFEREIKFIYDFNLNKVNKLGPYFTFEQLQNVDLHPAILNYISAEIDYLVFEDRQKLLKNSVFDYSGEKIANHFADITEEVKKIKRFSLEYIAKLILHATSFTVNYLVRPKWTLTRFLFDEAKHKSSNEIKQILNYVYYYKFVKKIIISYINTKKILSMNAEEFEELLNRTDKLGMESNLKGIMSSSFISMAEFFNIGQMQKTRIPLTAVELYLEEKDLPHHLQKITDTLGTDENAHFHIGDYMKIITSVMMIKKEEEPLQQDVLHFEEQPDVKTYEAVSVNENIFEDYENVNNHVSEFKTDVEDIDDISEILSNEDQTVGTETLENIENEITLKPNTKIRININDDNKIEPVVEAESIEADPLIQEEEKFDSYSSVIKGIEDDECESDDDLLIKSSDFNDDKENIIDNYASDEKNGFDVIEKQELFFGQNDSVFENAIDEDTAFEKSEDKYEQAYEEELDREDEIIQHKFEEQTKLELSEVLEHKNITKIIEVIFDYDIEDFATMLDEISNCKNVDDALFVINETLATRRINRNSKEAETLRDIISEYFNRR